MKLYENQEIVNELKRILKENYPYLEYSNQMSKRLSKDFLDQVSNDQLYVRVKPRMAHTARGISMIEDICEKLCQAIEIPFHFFHVQPPGRFYKSGDQRVPPQNLETQWISFCLKRPMEKEN